MEPWHSHSRFCFLQTPFLLTGSGLLIFVIRDNEIFISVIVFRSWTLSLRDPPCTTHYEKLHIWGGKKKCHLILQHLKCCWYLINTFPPLSENTKDVACRAFVVFLRIQIQSTFQKYGLSWRSVSEICHCILLQNNRKHNHNNALISLLLMYKKIVHKFIWKKRRTNATHSMMNDCV